LYKHIVFDFDGTLADSAKVALEVYNEMAEEYKFKKLTMEQYKKLSSLTLKDRFKEIGVPYYKPWLILELIKKARKEYGKLLDSISLFDGIHSVLQELDKRGYIISIISTNSRDDIKSFIKGKKLDFIKEVYSSKGLYGKAEVLKSYIKKNSIDKKELLYVADELRDLKICKKLNIDILSVTWGFDSRDLLSKYEPTYMIHEVEGILNVVP
jgi:phosphoglycolate phosphatase